ncbi:MAG: B12-binding domain-containing radical SAM protein [Chitinophagales bacterium]|nr:B12-binding domain-containing radical SAM protein [Chitinophagales bacterium]
MHICLIRPSKLILEGGLDTEVSHTSSAHATAPLGLALVAGSLRNAGYTVTVIDGNGEDPYRVNTFDIPYNSNRLSTKFKMRTAGLTPAEVVSKIPPDVDVVGISCMFTHNWLADRHLLNYMAEHLPKHVTFIAGGESISGLAEQCLKQVECLSVCVLGEGEETAIELMEALEKKTDLTNVKGIVFKRNGIITKTAKRNRLRTLDDLPLPAWDLFPVANYEIHHNLPEKNNAPTLPILATRGCPYTCTFCTSPDMWGTRYFMRSPQNVFNEMVWLHEKYGTISIEFYDLTAIIQKRWVLELAELIKSYDRKIYWKIPSGTRSEALDQEVAKALLESGCYTLTYAPESGSPRMLDTIHKKVSIPRMLQSIKGSKQAGLYLFINMILGLPGERHTDVWQSLWFIARCSWLGVDEMHLGIFRPYPGTALHNQLAQQGEIQYENDDYFIDSIMCIEEAKSSFNNKNVAASWYKFYYPLCFVIFFSVKYVRTPSLFIRTAKNLYRGVYENRIERFLLYFIQKKRNYWFFPEQAGHAAP